MPNDNLPGIYTRTDVEDARTKGQLVGWVQGALVAIGGIMLLGVIGWIPTLVVAGLITFGLYKLFSGTSK